MRIVERMNAHRSLLLAALLLTTLAARAQIALPRVDVPALPVGTAGIDRTLDRTLDTAGTTVRDLRQIRVRDLLRTNRTTLEADPRGAPMIRGEVVALAPTDAALRAATRAGFGIARRRQLEGLDVMLVVLRAPAGISTRQALKRLRRADPDGSYDFNHIYMESGEAASTSAAEIALPAPAASAPGVRVGVVDGGVDRTHPALARLDVHEHGCATAVPSAHGTSVASLIAGDDGAFHGAAPGATLYAADVYCGAATGGAVDALADALGWLSREHVPVINISLVGPDNRMLEHLVRLMLERGHVLVAAVGNDGPNAPPLFPAAYPGVVGVTAVDARDKVLLEACRGTQVMFAAPGADIAAAALGHAYASVRGTSFAAPIVAALLAQRLRAPDAAHAREAIAALAGVAVDLGPKGWDRIYGRGLVGGALRTTLAAR